LNAEWVKAVSKYDDHKKIMTHDHGFFAELFFIEAVSVDV